MHNTLSYDLHGVCEGVHYYSCLHFLIAHLTSGLSSRSLAALAGKPLFPPCLRCPSAWCSMISLGRQWCIRSSILIHFAFLPPFFLGKVMRNACNINYENDFYISWSSGNSGNCGPSFFNISIPAFAPSNLVTSQFSTVSSDHLNLLFWRNGTFIPLLSLFFSFRSFYFLTLFCLTSHVLFPVVACPQ